MIRPYAFAFCLLSSASGAPMASADSDCLNRFISDRIAVTDVRLLDSTMIEADLLNESAYHVDGYGLFYVFDLENGIFTEDVSMYMLKSPLAPGQGHTHRMRLADFDLAADEVNEVAVHVVSSEATHGSTQTVSPTFATCP